MPELSLIPYLEPDDGKFHLNVILPGTAADGIEHPAYPFRILDDSDPFSRILFAELTSGGSASASPLFLVLQKDSYHHRPGDMWPVNNGDVDRYWQQAHSGYSPGGASGHRHFSLKETMAQDGGLIPFRSLFLCTHKRRFFHPPCPNCGGVLDLCRDDKALSSNRLMPYGSSLKRYLYCSACRGTHTAFYTHTREEMEPSSVLDRHGLIRSWEQIASGRVNSGLPPCGTCTEKEACYGQGGMAPDRIVPFNFFPSYLLAFQAMSMAAADFLSLVSGAPMDEHLSDLGEKLQYGRRHCLLAWQTARGNGDLFLFKGEPAQFLEILYLKLSFMGDMARIYLDPETNQSPLALSAALDRLWVHVPNQNGLLPALWNFSTHRLSPGFKDNEADGLPGSHPSQISYCLGLACFFSLLANKNQPVERIKPILGKALKDSGPMGKAVDAPEFAPENIFWDPDAQDLKDMPREWRAAWFETLSLCKQLSGGGCLDTEGDGRKFLSGLDNIRHQVKQMLFFGADRPATPAVETAAAETPPVGAVPVDTTADSHIHGLLSRMLDECGPKEAPAPPPALDGTDETMTQTVILPAHHAVDLEETMDMAPAPETPKRDEEELLETVILQPKTGGEKQPAADILNTGPVDRPDVPETDDPIPETMILHRTIGDKMAPGTVPAPEQMDVPETVILQRGSGVKTPPGSATPPGGTGTQNGDEEENDMPETVIIRPPQTKEKDR